MTQLSEITSVHWQPALNGDGVVEGVDDIAQAIRLILGTPQGSDPHRPEFGSKLHLYIDMPIDRATPHVVRESVEAIRRWETRCEVIRVIPSISESRETIRVQWRLADGVIRETEVPR
ncbi:baseplate protein [Burkholderia ubonensis]|uniref:GPW/gp25 family protein n=1 Tax=Burkholderia ubonensis TaxID=101571 RepID=UPI000755D481|nr:GPW/gp25 family protein [Burkholderia ubonensis]KVC63488.1 baseplate protein [Burkholderia ubonensis]KVG24742.1 baseplate protein [Burkholderia ubonensis]KVP51459.1 baseplate protein [Burkholderia ubonensis]OJA62495.1 baseplate protein [Burkholderia ubonensis]